MKRKIAAIVAADIAGYSRLVSEDEEETLTRLESLRAMFGDFVSRFGGRIFNKAGDAILAEFPSAVDATRCAIDIQESMRTRNLAYQQSRRMELRIGITIGDVVERDGDLLGDGVNIAARLEGLAEPGGICVSRAVYESVANKLSVPFLDIGQQEVKNIPQPVHAFRVDLRGEARRQPVLPPKRERRGVSPVMAAGMAGGAAVAAVIAALVLIRAFPARAPDVPPAPIASPSMAAAPAASSQIALAPDPVAPALAAPTPPVVVAAPPTSVLPAPAAPAAVDQGPPLAIAPSSPVVAAPAAPAVAAPVPAPLPFDPAEAFARLARQGGIVQAPATPAEHYHNARSYEIRGDALAARQAYLAFAALDLDLLDPLLRFAALLRVQEGRAGAREVLGALAERSKSPAFRLAHAAQFDGPERLRRLETFAAENPAYAPAAYLIADAYSESRLGGQQTLADMAAELASLRRFLDADRDGRLQPRFLDHSVLADWIDQSRRRTAALEQMARPQRPHVTFMRHNTGWTVTAQLPEAATAFAWRVGDGAFRTTGASGAIDPRTGKPSPATWFELPGDTERAVIDVRYEDAAGRVVGPFAIPFEWRDALIASQKQILDQVASSWVQFGTGAPRDDLLYFTSLVVYRCAIAKAEIGFDGESPSRALPLPACERRDPGSVPNGATLSLRVPAATRSASVRLTYADGAQSEIATFRRP
jgi:class 3 adenylate cyclase